MVCSADPLPHLFCLRPWKMYYNVKRRFKKSLNTRKSKYSQCIWWKWTIEGIATCDTLKHFFFYQKRFILQKPHWWVLYFRKTRFRKLLRNFWILILRRYDLSQKCPKILKHLETKCPQISMRRNLVKKIILEILYRTGPY